MAKFKHTFFWAGFALALLTAFFNIGIIAMDDYFFVIAQVIPAQSIDPTNILKNNSLWFPLYPYLLHGLTSFFYRLGVVDPYSQLRNAMLVLTAITYPVSAYFLTSLFKENGKKAIALFFLGFYFLSPLFLTRPMIETVSAPFILASAAFATRYWKEGRIQHCLVALILLAVGSLFRYQIGVSSLALLFLIGARRNLKHLSLFLITGMLCIFFTGGIDYLLTGKFHGSLLSYLNYNLNYSGQNHGHQPFYTFFFLFIALSIPPVFFDTYRKFSWKEEYIDLLPVLLYFFVFLITHSMSPHKEERFMVPVLTLFFALLTPLALHLYREYGLTHWRILFFLIVNFLLLPIASFMPPQKNILELTRYLNKNLNITEIITIGETLPLYPDAFLTHQVSRRTVGEDRVMELFSLSCNKAVVIRDDLKAALKPIESNLVERAIFMPVGLERILIKTNPIRNLRRGPLALYVGRECP